MPRKPDGAEPKAKRMITIDVGLLADIEAEAERTGTNVSAWLSAAAKAELARRPRGTP